jgi:HB1, ASXL, restriction endonuclease HTH domain
MHLDTKSHSHRHDTPLPELTSVPKLGGFSMTYLEAAIAVLKSARRPLTAAELPSAAIDTGLLRPAGSTPKATMRAMLYGRIAKDPNRRLQRQFQPGSIRVKRGSVRWTYSR